MYKTHNMARRVFNMKTKIIFLFVLVFSYDAFAENDHVILLKNLKQQKHLIQQQEIGQQEEAKSQKKTKSFFFDKQTLEKLHVFISKHKDLPYDPENIRQVQYSSILAVDYFYNKYGTAKDNISERVSESDIPSEREREIYKSSFHIFSKIGTDKDFYIRFAGGDAKKAAEIEKRVNTLKEQYSQLCRKDRRLMYSDEAIKIDEEIVKACGYRGGRVLSFCRELRNKHYWNKYNELFLKVLKDDQVYYDYLYFTFDTLNHDFILEYIEFIKANGYADKFILSKDQVRFIAEDVMSKHQDIFNFNNTYYIDENGLPNVYDKRDAVNSLMLLSIWLNKYGLGALNEQLISKFFNKEIIETIDTFPNDTPDIKGYRDYLDKIQKRSRKKSEQ
jgi:hypothetical protein